MSLTFQSRFFQYVIIPPKLEMESAISPSIGTFNLPNKRNNQKSYKEDLKKWWGYRL